MLNLKEISDLNDPALEIYTRLNEVQLKRFHEPESGLFICESPKVIRRALDAGYEAESILIEDKYLLHSKDASSGPEEILADQSSNNTGLLVSEILKQNEKIPVYSAPLEVLTKLTGYYLTGGILCAMRRKPLLSIRGLLSDIISKKTSATDHNSDAQATPSFSGLRIAVLEDIENPTNVGAIFRSAAALGFDAVLLTEGCADPLYRRAARVSVGTVFQIPWTFLSAADESSYRNVSEDNSRTNSSDAVLSSSSYIDTLHDLGLKTAAMALSETTVPVDDPRLTDEENLAVIFGNENNGLLPETIAKSDYVVKIPMAEGVDSLNVAAASAVVFWQLRHH